MLFRAYMRHTLVLKANFGPVSPLRMPLWGIIRCNQRLILDIQISTRKMAVMTRTNRPSNQPQLLPLCHPSATVSRSRYINCFP